MQIRAEKISVEIVTRYNVGPQLNGAVTFASTGRLRARVLTQLQTRRYIAATDLQGELVQYNLSRSVNGHGHRNDG